MNDFKPKKKALHSVFSERSPDDFPSEGQQGKQREITRDGESRAPFAALDQPDDIDARTT